MMRRPAILLAYGASILATLLLSLGCASVSNPADVVDCEPDERECADDAAFRVCNATGDGWEVIACQGGTSCFAGLCQHEGNNGNNGTTNNGNNGGTNNDGNNGVINNGVNNTTNNGNNGIVNNGTNNNGTVNNGTVNNGETNNGTMESCEPFTRQCASPGLAQFCRADGTGFDFVTCPGANPCSEGFCSGTGQPGTCTPNARQCPDTGTLRICRPDGAAWDTYDCATGQFCDGTTCRTLDNCTDGDGDGYGTGDCLGADCDDTNADVNPRGFELCADGTDNDCDGIDPTCACNPIVQDCPAGDRLMCNIGPNSAFQCMSSGTIPAGGGCSGSAELCSRGSLCVGERTTNTFTCTTMCDLHTGTGCGGGQLCSSYLEDFIVIGLCQPGQSCDPSNEAACPMGQKCFPLNDSEGICETGGGALGERARCDGGQESNCGPGLFCVGLTNGTSECLPICRVGRANDCAGHQSQTCQPIDIPNTIGSEDFTLTAYGICF